eukprot:8999566-Lingulodinium_polyedra.AAC.1
MPAPGPRQAVGRGSPGARRGMGRRRRRHPRRHGSIRRTRHSHAASSTAQGGHHQQATPDDSGSTDPSQIDPADAQGQCPLVADAAGATIADIRQECERWGPLLAGTDSESSQTCGQTA